MILSSADILRVLGGDPVIRQEARLSIVDDKLGIGLDEYVYIYVQRYPTVDEFEATWKIWVQDGGSDVTDLVLAAMTRMLPNFDYHKTHYSTTDFKSDRTETEPAEKIDLKRQDALDRRFKLLSDEILQKVNGLRDGLDGIDGIDGLTGPQGPAGRDGVDGRDGRDIEATDTDLEDLRNVEQGIPYEKGQVLTWDGTKWTNLYVQQVFKSGGGGSATDTGAGGGPLGSSFWKYANNQSVPPGDKKVTFNNADYTLVTEVYIDKTNQDGDDVGNYLLSLIKEGTKLYLQRAKDSSKAVLFNVGSDAIDSGDYVTVVVTFDTSSGNDLDNNQDTTITVIGGGGSGGVTQIVAGSTVTIDPVGGTGVVTISADATATPDGGDFGGLPNPDGGDFDTGTTTSAIDYPVDGGDFNTGETGAFGDTLFNGGLIT